MRMRQVLPGMLLAAAMMWGHQAVPAVDSVVESTVRGGAEGPRFTPVRAWRSGGGVRVD